jgi:hypothetical protein
MSKKYTIHELILYKRSSRDEDGSEEYNELDKIIREKYPETKAGNFVKMAGVTSEGNGVIIIETPYGDGDIHYQRKNFIIDLLIEKNLGFIEKHKSLIEN